MKNSIIYFAILLTIGIFSCKKSGVDKPETELKDLKFGKVETDLIKASNNFTFSLFSKFEAEYSNENIFFSPLSISTALSMALNGANGETKQQIKNVIDFGDYTDEEINAAFKNMQDVFTALDQNVEFSLANPAWYRNDMTLMETYRDILVNYYYAEIAGLNFMDPASVITINNWIADKTKDKIKDMISELDPTTVLVLVNAIYFNGTWKYEFDKNDTYPGYFTGLNQEQINCEMMKSGKLKTKFLVDEDKSMACLPYGNGNYEMVLYMPKANEDLGTVIAGLTADKLNTMLQTATEDSVCVYLPKFKIETETLNISKILSDLGMPLAFSGAADFSNIFGPDLQISISKVLHKAFIKVNEEGTEAAAATVVIFEYTSTIGGSNESIIFFDHPFIFFIREVTTGEILFAGKLVDPVYGE